MRVRRHYAGSVVRVSICELMLVHVSWHTTGTQLAHGCEACLNEGQATRSSSRRRGPWAVITVARWAAERRGRVRPCGCPVSAPHDC